MALRVLLADESPTIKKVFQLALQDYAVEVTSVNLGVDVVTVAKNFQPDIIFADVLLQKRNGYDVCIDIRSDQQLKNTPVILMWSGFMDFDEERAQSCGANARIEKPFDVEALRKVIKDNVPKTQSQNLSDYLSFPKMPKMEEENKPPATESEFTSKDSEFTSKNSESKSESWDMDNFQPMNPLDNQQEENENFGFKEVPLQTKTQTPETAAPTSQDESMWVQSSVGSIQQEPPAVDNAFTGNFSSADMTSQAPADQELQVEELYEVNEIDLADHIEQIRPAARPNSQASISATDIEKYIEQACRKTLEQMLQDIVPKIAKEIVEREIQKLVDQQN